MSADITSASNPKLKSITQLRKSAQERRRAGLAIVDGVKEIRCALKSGAVIVDFIYKESDSSDEEVKKLISQVKAAKGKVFSLSDKIFEKVCYGQRDSDPLAVMKIQSKILADLPKVDNPLYVIIENVEKPGNLGAILRTCDAAGVNAVIICENKTDMYNPNVIRASLGTIFSLPVIATSNESALEFLKKQNVQICAAVPEAEQVYVKHDFRLSTAVVLGEEHFGLSEFWRKNCTVKLSIPMKGAADSLNVSASTAILVFEAMRQRANKTS